MLVLLDKKTGRHIMSQSGDDPSHLETLIQNGRSSGYAKKDLEAVVMPDAEFHRLLAAQAEADMDYRRKRARDFPSIAEQLDMLWHAIDAGKLDKKSEFYTTLKAVKDAHPGPKPRRKETTAA